MRHGHNLEMQRVNDEVIAVCKCGKWQAILPAPADVDLITLVARAVNQHEKHLDNLGRPSCTEPPGSTRKIRSPRLHQGLRNCIQ
jgi:hypothetical protein